MVLKENGGPAVRWLANEILSTCNGALELREGPVTGRSLKLVWTLANVDNVLGDGVSAGTYYLQDWQERMGTHELKNHV